VSIPTPAEIFAAFFGAGHQAEVGEVTFGPCDRAGAGVTLGSSGGAALELEAEI
jgi:hypothetical protein